MKSSTPAGYDVAQSDSHADVEQADSQLERATQEAFARHADSELQHIDLSQTVQASSPEDAGQEETVGVPQADAQSAITHSTASL